MPFSIEKSDVKEIKNITISNLQQSPLVIKYSQIWLVDDLKILNCQQNLQVSDSVITQLINSYFENNGGTGVSRGGALILINSNVTIVDSQFINNKAEKGGAIYFSWTNLYQGFLNITQSNFTGNSASSSGGALQYDLYRPNMINNNFGGNTAEYGPDIASYPIVIKIKDTDIDQIVLNDVGSGVEDNFNLKVALYDQDGQITTLENSTQIQIRNIDKNTQVLGKISIVVDKGVVNFQTLSFEAEPGIK